METFLETGWLPHRYIKKLFVKVKNCTFMFKSKITLAGEVKYLCSSKRQKISTDI